MEGIPKLTSVQTKTLVQVIKLQKRRTGFTIRELTYATKNKAPSTVHTTLGILLKKGVVSQNEIMPETSQGIKLVARHSYKTDIDVVEHDGTVALFRMFK